MAADRHRIDTRRLLYPLIGERNAKHFERLHSRASLMKQISTPKHLRASMASEVDNSSSDEKTAKRHFFETVRIQLSNFEENMNSHENNVVICNVLATLIVSLTSKKVLFADMNGKDCFAHRLVPNLLRLSQDRALMAENTNMSLENAAPKLAYCVLCVLCCESTCAELCITFGVAHLVCKIVEKGLCKLVSLINPQNLKTMEEARQIDEDDVAFHFPYVGIRSLRCLTQNALAQPSVVPRFRLEQIIYGGCLNLFIWLQRPTKGSENDVALNALRKMKTIGNGALKLFPTDMLHTVLEKIRKMVEMQKKRFTLPSEESSSSESDDDESYSNHNFGEIKKKPIKAFKRVALPQPPSLNQSILHTLKDEDNGFEVLKSSEETIRTLSTYLKAVELLEKRKVERQKKLEQQEEGIRQLLSPVQRAPETTFKFPSLVSKSPGNSPGSAMKKTIKSEKTKKKSMRKRSLGTDAKSGFSFDHVPQSVLAYVNHIKKIAIACVGIDELIRAAEKDMDLEVHKDLAEAHIRRGKRKRKQIEIAKKIRKEKASAHFKSKPVLKERLARPMTPAEKLRAEQERLERIRQQELLEERRKKFQEELGGIRMIVGNDGKIKRDPEKLRREAAALRRKQEEEERIARKKREEKQKKINEQVRNIRFKIETEMEIEARRKKEIARKNSNFAKQYREKTAERKKSQDAEKFEENRKIKYKVDQYLRNEAKKKAHYDRYANESREDLMARLEMKDREKARILKMEKDKREVQQILQITKKTKMREARVKRKKIEAKEKYRYKARKLRWIENYDEGSDSSFWVNNINGAYVYENPLEDYGVDIYEEYHNVWYKYFPSTDTHNLGEILGKNFYRTVEALEEERYKKELQKYYEENLDLFYYDESWNAYMLEEGENGPFYLDLEGNMYDMDGQFLKYVGLPASAYQYYEEGQRVVEAYVPGPPPLKKGMPGYVPPPPPLKKGMPGYVPPPPPPKQGMPNFDTYVPPPPPRRTEL